MHFEFIYFFSRDTEHSLTLYRLNRWLQYMNIEYALSRIWHLENATFLFSIFPQTGFKLQQTNRWCISYSVLHCCYVCTICARAVHHTTPPAYFMNDRKKREEIRNKKFNDTFSWRWIPKSYTYCIPKIERGRKQQTNK